MFIKADEALLNAFVEVADINKRVQAKLKKAPADVLNDDVKRAQYIEEIWAEETGVASVGDEDVKFGGKNVSPEEMAKARFNLAAVESHKKKLEEKFNAKASEVSEEQLKSEIAVRDNLADALADKSKNGIVEQFVKKVNEDVAKRNADADSGVKFSKSSPDSSDTAYILKGEKPVENSKTINKRNEKLEKKIERLEKTNADITARLADAYTKRATKRLP